MERGALSTIPWISSGCFGINVEEREDAGPLVTILVEDDGNWFEKVQFDAGWIPNLIMVLQCAKDRK